MKREVETHGRDARSEKRQTRRRWVMRGVLIAALLGAAGFLLAASGIIPITASSRHWAITRWFLNFSKERSVATHSIGIKVPPLNDEWRILKGAGHFETGCRPCHGSPDVPQPRIAFAMTPNPPPLSTHGQDFEPAELFYIVKHGIKFTGMPAWPSQNRDDEVWDMVAFLRKLPELDGEQYRRLVHGTATPDDDAPLQELLPSRGTRNVVSQNCARCHGSDGNGRGNEAFPALAGQKEQYLYASMKAYLEKRRHSGIMEPIAAGLDDAAMREIARYYSALPRRASPSTNAAAIARGETIALRGIPARRVAACAQCHGPSPVESNPFYPRLAGQYAGYLELQLGLFQKRARGGTPYSHVMHYTADTLSAEERRDVALYYSSLEYQTTEDEP
ncbi:MAG TPA: c-type cytochrome [Verrucomicrobiae bacterium]|nr:c-type cytochrome [Verrucomicrobiae bacterium]